MSILTDLVKAKTAVKAALALFEQLAAAIAREDNRAIGYNMSALGRELRTIKRLLEGE